MNFQVIKVKSRIMTCIMDIDYQPLFRSIVLIKQWKFAHLWGSQNHEGTIKLNKYLKKKLDIVGRQKLTITTHSKFEALLKSTILTSVPINSINNTLLISRTLIINNRTLWASKKSFASFACYDAIMNAWWLIAANFTRDDFDLSWNEKK